MRTYSAGFTLIELLVGVTIIGMIVAFAVRGFQEYARYQQYDQMVGSVLGTLNDARVQGRAAESGVAHGVKLQTSSIIAFNGTTYSAGASTNRTYTFQNVRITPALTGGATQIVFDALTGRPSATGTITIVGTAHVATTTVTISGTGVIQ